MFVKDIAPLLADATQNPELMNEIFQSIVGLPQARAGFDMLANLLAGPSCNR